MKKTVRRTLFHYTYVTKALIFLLLFAAALPQAIAAEQKPATDEVPVGKVEVVKLLTTLLRPLKPQNYEREIDIYLPAAYVNDPTKSERFPVLYLLHGSPGLPTDFVVHGHWQIFLEQEAKRNNFLPPIIVAPDGNYTQAAFGDSEWLNSADSQNKFEDFVAGQLVSWIDRNFRTIATQQARTIGGVSEGGYGAVNIALHAPTVFGNVIALSGYYANDGSGWARKSMGHNKAFLAYNSPLSFINSPSDEASLIQSWQTQRYFIGSGIDEKRYTTESKEMADQLRQHDIPTDLCQLDGKHGWELWNTLFTAGVDYIYSPDHPTTVTGQSLTQQTP